jgi:LCP family protein required for cell wall assembly
MSTAEPAARHPRRRRRIVLLVLLVVVLLVVAYAATLAFSITRALQQRNDALPAAARTALDDAAGSARTSPRTILVLGADSSRARRDTRGSAYGGTDSMLLVRIDPKRKQVDMLSLPRDLYVDVPDAERSRIGQVYEQGGAALAIRTVRGLLDMDVNHVAVVDFDGFRGLVDALGGIEIYNPFLVRSAVDFDGRSWAFPSGTLRLDGRRALAYARVRKVDQASILRNRDEGEELGRAFRQQRVLEATLRRIRPAELLRSPIRFPGSVLDPITTDIELAELLGWARAGAGDGWGGLRCRIGGSYVPMRGETVLMPRDAEQVAEMFVRSTKPVPPLEPTDGGCIAAEADNTPR